MDKPNERVEQIRRQWASGLKYTRHTDPAAVELHEMVTDLLDEIEVLEDGEIACDHDLDLDYDHGDLTYAEHDEELARVEQAHAARIGDLAPAIEQLHNQAHGVGSLYMCSADPCRDLYRMLPNARGVILAGT